MSPRKADGRFLFCKNLFINSNLMLFNGRLREDQIPKVHRPGCENADITLSLASAKKRFT